MTDMTTHIVAMGGGGFSTSEGYTATGLDRYVLSLTSANNPLVCFVPTASGDNGLYVSRFMNAYSRSRARTSVLTLWEGAADSLARLDEVDVFLVGGGNTVNMMALWAAHGVSRKLQSIAADPSRDIVLAGMGAGGAAWFEACATDGYGTGVTPFPHGLGLVPGSFCPHFDGEAERRPRFTEYVDTGQLPAGWGADNGAGLHFVDGVLDGCYAERADATVYRVEQTENGARVTPQKATQLEG
ncbi:peptidase S51 family protein [Austwickia chelonae NBRC 105200]|uniref:Peptidase S51 family protein n=2 Tax=Austwickia TaxID=1184606 RepID=K6W9D1_9MICO|nr:peptidase S51 family protein [Austwickia chelonae NBRC 105200]